MIPGHRTRRLLAALVVLLAAGRALAQESLYIDSHVTISKPMDVGDVVVVSGGRLTVAGVGSPGFRIRGNLLAAGTGQVSLERSVVAIESTYHGQYIVVAAEQSSIDISGCTYRVPAGVQHAIVAAGTARITITDSSFDPVQLAAVQTGRLLASRLDGRFEVIVQNDGHVEEPADIPRRPGGGVLWVWPEFPSGSLSVYSPPLPGLVPAFVFPPAGATGIGQSFVIANCQVLLWPMLVRAGSDLTLRDITPDNWVIVGLHLPSSQRIAGLRNGETVALGVLPLTDRTLRLERATVDAWNLYPLGARVEVSDSTIGELVGSDTSRTSLTRVTVDGSGGYCGAEGNATLAADSSEFTCDVQTSENATIELHRSALRPYPHDPDGHLTHLGAYDSGRVLLDHTSLATTPALGGHGLIAACAFTDPPARPPAPGDSVDLTGTVSFSSPDAAVAAGRWQVLAVLAGQAPELLGQGSGNVSSGPLGRWTGRDARADAELQIILTDGLGRTLTGRWPVPHARVARPVVRRP